MNRKTLLLGFCALSTTICAQKPPLDLNALANWRASIYISEYSPYFDIGLSTDGRFLAFNERINNDERVVMESTDGAWKKEIEKASCKAFSRGDQVVVEYSDKSVGIESLGSGDETRLTGLDGYFLSRPERPKWIAYRLKDSHQTKLRNLETGQEQTFPYADDVAFSRAENDLLLQTHAGDSYQVLWVNLQDGTSTEIHKSPTRAVGLSLDQSGTRAAFLDKTGTKNALWYYTPNDGQAKLVLEEGAATDGLPIQRQIRFGKANNNLFITIGVPQYGSPPKPKPDEKVAQLDVFSYGDNFIGQRGYVAPGSTFLKVNPTNGSTVVLTQGYEREWGNTNGDLPDQIVVEKGIGTGGESMWRKQASESFFLTSTEDGSRQYLGDFNDTMGSIGAELPRVSPTGKYAVDFDRKDGNYFSYNIKTRKVLNATQAIRYPLYNEEDDHAAIKPSVSMFVSWAPEDRSFYVFDRYDLWSVDPEGVRPPINLTRGYGRKHNIVFGFDRLMNDDAVLHPDGDNTIILCALNKETKANGFYRLNLDGSKDPEELTMGPYMYCADARGLDMDGHSYLFTPKHAGDYYILARMSASESPNYFLTKDFKKFKEITHSHPEANYNWLTSALITWKSLDGTPLQGILYRPEDFDPHKKYPSSFAITKLSRTRSTFSPSQA